ncbi:UbiX family flavin prenyltransferase [Anaerocolumna sedimenticola]|uniref:Flavin prenyltransferase UbiX n=1 Tax=Anaerocolumna sedimenticola TaxID=2696063 RepID=A0A6P1TMN8_9FIRM|nr:UbiX family flavin prenyltransferase [Anaerocolumna sedimenticola]QHQ61116.1 UbiX family flavin prenyltransferase [Anaerocolumna sedimenticola]
MKRYIIGITGASGSVLAKRLLSYLSDTEAELHIIATDMGKKVFEFETGIPWTQFLSTINQNKAEICSYDNNDMFASVASGSFVTDAMMIVPCSMATAAKIATGTGGNLLCRAADVCLKEKTKLVISPREAPLNSIHLKNLLTLSENGSMILPPVPMFYAKSEDYNDLMDGIVGRILKSAGIENNLYTEWRG